MNIDDPKNKLSLKQLVTELFKGLFVELVVMTIGRLFNDVNTKYVVTLVGTVVTGIATFFPWKINYKISGNLSNTNNNIGGFFKNIMSVVRQRPLIINLITFVDIAAVTYVGVWSFESWQDSPSFSVFIPMLLLLTLAIGMWRGKWWARAINGGFILFFAMLFWQSLTEPSGGIYDVIGLAASGALLIYLFSYEKFKHL